MKMELDTMDQHCDRLRKELVSRSDQTDCSTPPDITSIASELLRISETNMIFFDGAITCQFENCSKIFTSSKTYRNHRTKFHKKSPYYCVVCCSPCAGYNELLQHFEKEGHKVSCPVCPPGCTFPKPVDATIHFGKYHRRYVCSFCSKSFAGSYSMKNHVSNCCDEVENDEAFVASSCVEITMNSSFNETNDAPSTFCDDIPTLEVAHPGEEIFDNYKTNATDRNPSTLSQCLKESNSETETAESDLVIPEADVPESNDIGAVSPSDLASHSVLESYPDLEILNHCVLGSGGDELPSFNCIDTNISTISDLQEDDGQWIGHNVNMFMDMSEKHKSIFKFNCETCACSFTTELMLRKHEKTHDHACKYCPQRFNSLPEYRTHLKVHILTDTHFPCSVCGHNCEGLKNLMAHEMHHRLNSAFRQEIENFTTLSTDLMKEQNEFDCEICQDHVVGMSMWFRHKIWHRWDGMWTSYVLGRSFKGTFTVEDATTLKHVVEVELCAKWRDCLMSKVVSANRKSKEGLKRKDLGSEIIEDQNCDKIPDDTSTIPNSVDERESEIDDEPENEGVSHAINGWMSYWQSYLGLDKVLHSWVKPILKDLRSQWKSYHVNEQDLLYRKMDQIGVMIRAQKSGDLVTEGPWVILERIPQTVVSPKKDNIANRSSRKASSRVIGKSSSIRSGESLSAIPEKSPSTTPKESSSTICGKTSSNHHSILMVPRLSRSSDSSMDFRASQSKKKPCINNNKRTSFHKGIRHLPSRLSHSKSKSAIGETKSPIGKRNRISLSPSAFCHEVSETCERDSPPKKRTRLSRSTLQSAHDKLSCVESVSKSEGVKHSHSSLPHFQGGNTNHATEGLSAIIIKEPVICLTKLKLPAQSSSGIVGKRQGFEVTGINQVVLSESSMPSLEQITKRIKSEILNHPIPKWAEILVKEVFNSALNNSEKENKTNQILSLLKSYYFRHMELEPKMRPIVLLKRI